MIAFDALKAVFGVMLVAVCLKFDATMFHKLGIQIFPVEMIKCNLLEIFPAIRVMKLLAQTKSIASHLANGRHQDFVKKVSFTCNLLCLFF